MPSRSTYLLDLNVLIALSWPQHVHHDRAHAWLAGRADQPWATTPITESGFVRLSTNPAVVYDAIAVPDALAALRALRAMDGHVFLADPSSLADPAIVLSRAASTRQVTDLHLVNLCARSDAVLATFDQAIPTYLEPADRSYVVLL